MNIKGCIILQVLFWGFSMAIVAFDCNKEQTKQIEVSLVDIKPCLIKTPNITNMPVTIQLLQPKSYEKTKYYRCLIEVQHLISRCGVTFDTFHDAGLYSEVVDLGQKSCKTLIDEGFFFYKGIKIEKGKNTDTDRVSITTFGSITSNGGCNSGGSLVANNRVYDRAVRQSDFSIITEKGEAKIDIESKKVVFYTGESCPYEKLECFSSNLGYIYWNSITPTDNCPSEDQYDVIFEGDATRVQESSETGTFTSYFIHYSEYDFQIGVRLTSKRVCGVIAYHTEHPKLLIVEKDKYGFSLKYNKKIMNENLNIMTYFNSKLLYIVRHVKDQMTSLYKKVSHDRCVAESKIIHNMLTLAFISPQNFAYEYMDRPGYTSTVRGEVAYISQCEPVSVNITKSLECYQELPVIYNNEKYFILPRSKILTKIGTLIDCSNVMDIKYKLNNNWYTLSNGLISTQHPNIISVNDGLEWTFKEIKDLAATGIYTQSDLDNVQKIIMSPIEHEVLTSRITRTFSGEAQLPAGYSVYNTLTEKDLQELSKSAFKQTFGKLTSFLETTGSYFSLIMGSFLIIRFIKFILNNFINATVLYQTFGLSWKLLFFWWENLVHLFLRKSSRPLNKEMKKDYLNNEQVINLV